MREPTLQERKNLFAWLYELANILDELREYLEEDIETLRRGMGDADYNRLLTVATNAIAEPLEHLDGLADENYLLSMLLIYGALASYRPAVDQLSEISNLALSKKLIENAFGKDTKE